MIALVGCGAATPPEPARSSPTQAASPIPPVKNPRDVSALARRPCDLLTSQQAAGFGLDLPPRQKDGVLGNVDCEWLSTTPERQTLRQVIISTFTNNPTLEIAYDQDRGRPYFELTVISGYPTLVSRPTADTPDCDIDVKPAERQSISISYHSYAFKNNPQQACVVGKQVAAAVLMNL
ncbi:MAG: DUF3558 domain-containing protein, partial [Pseudonocardiales bacterium]|nr:DUF3558 domain-containing protein [Pseudonocardiales bacterium]